MIGASILEKVSLSKHLSFQYIFWDSDFNQIASPVHAFICLPILVTMTSVAYDSNGNTVKKTLHSKLERII